MAVVPKLLHESAVPVVDHYLSGVEWSKGSGWRYDSAARVYKYVLRVVYEPHHVGFEFIGPGEEDLQQCPVGGICGE